MIRLLATDVCRDRLDDLWMEINSSFQNIFLYSLANWRREKDSGHLLLNNARCGGQNELNGQTKIR